MVDPFGKRLAAVRDKMQQMELDGFLVSVPENRYYLSGFEAGDMQLTESSGFLVIGLDRQALLTDFRYQEEASHQAPGYELLIYKEGWEQVLSEVFGDFGIHRLGVEGHHLTHKRFLEVRQTLQKLRGERGDVVVLDGLVEELRMVKDSTELDRLRAAVSLTEEVFDRVWQSLRPGVSEKQVAWEIEAGIREAGAEAVSFPPIVGSGPNGALPHAVPTDRKVEADDAVVLDVGARLRLYCSDMTRTWIGPRAPQKIREIYRIVREAQLAAMEAIRPRIDSHQVDQIARNIIQRAGYGEAFGHGLGHGVGLAVHEKPGYGKKNSVVLQENMVLTVEPGIYLPGLGGVRLENMVRVTGSGCESLSRNAWFLKE
ncbi:Xaa-Pro aminopeptidase [Desulfacinum hydrothermale DSM 13146]|uniref:Xaa-Pro aminopeptidase n=1 Tax=Desulfacinum hydrothermale DSM 13146 TaxID=1121390 RepID=A0A1W1X4J5_9BACT|nr:Xaa-Pro peptidase family protein [Desulfacinum hydrothermale]SMC18826.1 Xaa-Pro aminopeptidase [Desulfacinum hydrothermale DSM 13146]